MDAFFSFLSGSFSPSHLLTHDDKEFHTCHWVRRDLNSKMRMFGMKDYGVVTVLQLLHWRGVEAGLYSFIRPAYRSSPENAACQLSRGMSPSTPLHFSASQALLRSAPPSLPASCIQSLTLRSPLISVCMQMRMMMKKQSSGTLQHSEDKLSSRLSSSFTNLQQNASEKKGFVTT